MRRTETNRGALGLLVVLLILTLPRSAASLPPPQPWTESALHLKILMRALTYEHSLAQRTKRFFRVGVLYDPDDERSRHAATTVILLLKEQARRLTFLQRQLVVVSVPLQENGRLEGALQLDLSALYLSTNIDDTDIKRVVEITRRLKIISMTGVRPYIDLGVTLAVVLRHERPQIIINFPASQAEGARFSSQLLQLAEVIGKR